MPFDDAGFGQVAKDLAVLRAARSSLQPRGSWCRGAFARAGGQRCAVGWLVFHARVDNSRLGLSVIEDLVERGFGSFFPDGETGAYAQLIDFNDASDRKSCVVRMFDRAIERLEGGGTG